MSNLNKYYKDARERTKRRKSPWNWILFPLAIIGIVGVSFLLEKGFLIIQHCLIPRDAILSGRTPAGSFLMFVPIFFPSFTIGFMFANFSAWCIPPARRALNSETRGTKGTSFKEAMKVLSIVSIIVMMIAGPLSLLGTFNYFYIKPEGIYINPLFSFKERCYKWSDIVKINARCLAERDNLHLNYILKMTDGGKIDIFSETRLKFVTAYPRLKPFLKAQSQIIYEYQIRSWDIRKLREFYLDRDVEKIVKIIKNEE